MNKYIRIIFLALLIIPVQAYTQQAKCTVSGRVIDEMSSPVAYASVAVYKDNSPLTGTITDHKGKFSLKVAQGTESCQLVVEFIGYSKVSQEFVSDKSQLNLGAIVLKEDAISLEEVTVSAKEVVQKSTVEHTTINASSNISSDKGTAIDILRSASSVSVSDNGILIRGNSNILVLMDGVPTTASDLSTIPADNIKSIEVITNTLSLLHNISRS